MRKYTYLLFAFVIKIILFLFGFYIILQVVKKYILTQPDKITRVENFTPGIRKLVRPHLRNARVATEEYREYFTDKTNSALKIAGLQFV